MIGDLKPYAQTKDSALPWLGRIPAHWLEKRAKYFFREVDERSKSGNEVLMSVSHKTGVTPRKQNVTMFLAESTVGYKICRPGDIAINTMWAFMGALGIARQEGIVSPSYGVYRPQQTEMLNSKYLDSLLRTDAYKSEYIRRSTGINSSRLRLYPDQFLQIPLICPPLDEQEAIAHFLSWATNRLDRAIQAKRRIIALLNEQKQAIIHRAVTRGFNHSVPLKDSGIPWLGEIPENWEVKKLKHLARFVNGFAFKPGDWRAEGIPIIRIQNLNGSLDYNYTSRPDLPSELLIQPGDLMFAWSGNRGTSFGSFEWTRDFPGYLNQHIFKVVDYELPRRYFCYLLRAVTRHIEEQAGGIIGLVHITKPELCSVQVPVAPADEAAAIAREIDDATAGIQLTVSRLEREIELLREYRTRLVADVVTGKLDVREAATRVPDEELLPDPSDAGDEPDDLPIEEEDNP